MTSREWFNSRTRSALTLRFRLILRHPSKHVAGLTFEHPAHCVEGGEAHGLAPVLEHGDVRWGDADLFRELSDRHLAAREHDVDVDDDRHHTTSSSSRRSIVALRNRDPHDTISNANAAPPMAAHSNAEHRVGTASNGTSDSAIVEQRPSHHNPLNLVRALIDLRDLRIPHHPLNGKVLGIAVAAKQLDRVRGDLHCHIRGEALRSSAEVRQVSISALGLGGRSVRELTRSFKLHAHVSEHELQALKVRECLAELLALLGIAERIVEGTLSNADGLRGDGDSGVVQGSHCRLEAGSLSADHAGLWDAYLVEVNLTGWRALDAELLLRSTKRHTRVGLLYHEGADSL